MATKSQILSSLGVKKSNPYASPIRLISPYIDPATKPEFVPPVFSDTQKLILNTPVSADLNLNIWRHVSGTTYNKANPQHTLETFLNISKKKSNLAVLDIETLGGLGDSSAFWMPTEISIRTYRNKKLSSLASGYKNASSVFNILIAPSQESKKQLNTLIAKASSGAQLTLEERTVLVHLLRYGEGFSLDPTSGAVSSYSKYFDMANNLIESNTPLNGLGSEFGIAMKNLEKYGLSEDISEKVVKEKLGFLSDHVLIGHNINAFDIEKLKMWGGSDLQEVLSSQKTLDTLSLLRILDSNPHELYKALLENEDLSMSKIGKGPYSLDVIRDVLGLDTSMAHSGSFDTLQQAQISGIISQKLLPLLEAGNITGTDWLQFQNTRIQTNVLFDKTAIKKGDIFFARKGLEGDEMFDFAVNMVTGEKTAGKVVMNRGFFYEFMGYSKVKSLEKEQEIYVAEFFSETLNRKAYIASDSVEGLASKIHGSSLAPWQLASLESVAKSKTRDARVVLGAQLRSQIESNSLDDLARRRWLKMFQVEDSQGKYFGIRLLEDYLNVAEQIDSVDDISKLGIKFFSPELQRDFERIYPRLKAEAGVLREAVNIINESDLSSVQKNVALARWYHRLGQEALESSRKARDLFSFEGLGIDVLDPSSSSLKTFANISDEDSFAKSIYGIINRNSPIDVHEKQVEKTKEAVLNRIIRDLQAREILDKKDAEALVSLEATRAKISILRDKILESSNLQISDTIELESLMPRNLNVDSSLNRALVEESVLWTKSQISMTETLTKSVADRLLPSIGAQDSQTSKRLTTEAYKLLKERANRYNYEVIPVIGKGDRPMVAIFASGDRASVAQAMIKDEMSPFATYIDLPYMDKKGNIVFGNTKKIRQAGRSVASRSKDKVKLSVIDPVDDVLESVRTNLFLGLPKATDLEAAEMVSSQDIASQFSKGMHKGLQSLSGVSYLDDPFGKINSLESRGTVSDVLKSSYLRASGLIPGVEDFGPMETYEAMKNLPGYLNKHKLELAGAYQELFSKIYDEDLSLEQVADLMHFSYRGVRDSAIVSGSKGIISPLDPAIFTVFGHYLHPRRPNTIQRLNYMPLDYDFVTSKLANVKGATANPLLVTKAMRNVHKNIFEPGHVTGVNLKGVTATYEDLSKIIDMSSLPRDLRPDTWENIVIMSSESAASLTTRTRKNYVIDTRTHELSSKISDILEGKINLEDNPLLIERGYGLASAKTPSGHEALSPFRGNKGQIMNVRQDGHNVIIDIDDISEVVNSTKIDIDGRKGTVFINDKIFEQFGDDVHFAFAPNPLGHMDFLEADLAGTIKLAAEKNKGTIKGRKAFARSLNKHFGIEGQWVRLPGQKEYTFEVPNHVDLTDFINKKGAPLKDFMLDMGFKNNTVVTASGYEVPILMSEVRRINVNEIYNFADMQGKGLEKGYGVRLGFAEMDSIRIKGLEYGVDVDPILKWIDRHGRVGDKFESRLSSMKGFYTTLKAISDDQELSKIKVLSLDDLEVLPAFTKQGSFLNYDEISGTILGREDTFAISLPDSIEVITKRGRDGSAEATRSIDRLVISKQVLGASEEGKIFLNQEQSNLRHIYQDLLELNDLSVDDTESRKAILDRVQSRYQSYLDGVVNQMTSGDGFVHEEIYKRAIPGSGYFRGFGMAPPDEWTPENAQIIKISREAALERYGRSGVERMEEGEFYAFLQRNPNVSSESIVPVQMFVSDELQGNGVAISSLVVTRLGGDFDGDDYAVFVANQEATRNLWEKQAEESVKYHKVLREHGGYHGGEAGGESFSRGIFDSVSKVLEDHSKTEELYALAEGTANELINESVFTSRMGKVTTGSLYNTSLRAREIALAVFDHEGEAGKIRLIDEMSRVSAEPMSLKSKHGMVNIPENFRLIRELAIGDRQRLSEYASKYGDLLDKDVVWRHEDVILKHAAKLGYENMSVQDLIESSMHEQVETAARADLGKQFIDAFTEMRERVTRSSPYGEDLWHRVSSKLFFSKQASGDIVSALEALDAQGIPTYKAQKVAADLGNSEIIEQSSRRFYEAGAEYSAELGSSLSTKARLEGLSDEVLDSASAGQKVAQWAEGINWKSMGKKFAVGAGIALGLYVTAKALQGSKERREPPSSQSTPTARVAPDQGLDIKIRAKNRSNVNTEEIADNIGQQMGGIFGANNGQINLTQRDDTRSINSEWLRELFTTAVNSS